MRELNLLKLDLSFEEFDNLEQHISQSILKDGPAVLGRLPVEDVLSARYIVSVNVILEGQSNAPI